MVAATQLKNMHVKFGFIFPNFRGENKTYLSCHHLVVGTHHPHLRVAALCSDHLVGKMAILASHLLITKHSPDILPLKTGAYHISLLKKCLEWLGRRSFPNGLDKWRDPKSAVIRVPSPNRAQSSNLGGC